MSNNQDAVLELGKVTVYITHHDKKEEVMTCNSLQDFERIVYENVPKVHEIKVVDNTDSVIFQVIDKTLIFPIPELGAPNNIWNDEHQQFETVSMNS